MRKLDDNDSQNLPSRKRVVRFGQFFSRQCLAEPASIDSIEPRSLLGSRLFSTSVSDAGQSIQVLGSRHDSSDHQLKLLRIDT